MLKVFGINESEMEARIMDLVERQPHHCPARIWRDQPTGNSQGHDRDDRPLIAPVVEKIREAAPACIQMQEKPWRRLYRLLAEDDAFHGESCKRPAGSRLISIGRVTGVDLVVTYSTV